MQEGRDQGFVLKGPTEGPAKLRREGGGEKEKARGVDKELKALL